MQRGQLQEPLEDSLSEAALEDYTKLRVDALQLNSDLRLFLPGDLDGKVLDDGAGLSPDTTIDTQHKRGEVNAVTSEVLSIFGDLGVLTDLNGVASLDGRVNQMGSIKDGSDGDINGQVAAILVEADLDVSGALAGMVGVVQDEVKGLDFHVVAS